MGFKFEKITPPSYWYINFSEIKRYHRSVFMKHKIVSNPTTKTEYDIMLERGYDRIWDCGTLKYVYCGKKSR
jgi:hypothetical protein